MGARVSLRIDHAQSYKEGRWNLIFSNNVLLNLGLASRLQIRGGEGLCAVEGALTSGVVLSPVKGGIQYIPARPPVPNPDIQRDPNPESQRGFQPSNKQNTTCLFR